MGLGGVKERPLGCLKALSAESAAGKNGFESPCCACVSLSSKPIGLGEMALHFDNRRGIKNKV